MLDVNFETWILIFSEFDFVFQIFIDRNKKKGIFIFDIRSLLFQVLYSTREELKIIFKGDCTLVNESHWRCRSPSKLRCDKSNESPLLLNSYLVEFAQLPPVLPLFFIFLSFFFFFCIQQSLWRIRGLKSRKIFFKRKRNISTKRIVK